MESSDIPDDQYMKQFKQILDKHCSTQKSKRKQKQIEAVKTASLRPNLEAEEDDPVSATTQQYVSEQLAAKLDQELDEQQSAITVTQEPTRKIKCRSNHGIKLLQTSAHCVKIPKASDEVASCNEHNANARKKLRQTFTDKQHMDQCRLVAVDGNAIIARKDIAAWSNRSKGKVFCYKKIRTSRVLELQEPLFH